jgi:hypothetical protein
MLATTHSLTSAVIISQLPSPALGLPVVLASHYLLDLIPHWDTGSGLTKDLKTRKKAFFETLIDLATAGILVFLFFQNGKPFSPLLWGAVILGILPDLLEFPALFFDIRPFPLNYLEKFHTEIMHQRAKLPWGLIPQIIIILLVILFIKH